MTFLKTQKSKFFTAKCFKDSLGQSVNNSFYLAIGRTLGEGYSGTIPTANNSVQFEQDNWETINAAKRIYFSDIEYVIPKNDWSLNTTFVAYDTNSDFYSANTIVYTNNNSVYMCISNNTSTLTTEEPYLTSTSSNQLTADGYQWRYLFDVNANQRDKFCDSNNVWIPALSNLNELNPNHLMISTKLIGTEANTFPIGADSKYQTYMIIHNPIDSNSNCVANLVCYGNVANSWSQYSGNLFFIENISYDSERSEDQVENIKIVFEF
jgi:hypothetical protein